VKSSILIFLLSILLVIVIIGATGLGFLTIHPGEVLKIIGSKLFSLNPAETANPTFSFVVLEVRLPRILTAALVGGGLSVAGAVFQAILLNPLADPYTLGISPGAAFGASLAIIFTIIGLNVPPWLSIPVLAFIGAIATLAAVFSLSSPDSQFSSNTLILSGVIVSAILSAGIGFIKYLADEQVGVIIFWLMGSFVGKTWGDVALVLILTLPCLLCILFFSRDLNILALGTRTADTLGINSTKIRKLMLVCGSIMTAGCVCVSGIIGFVGLIVPHLLRTVMGPDNRFLVPACFLGGAVLLLCADTVTRAVLPTELPIGVLTSLIGGPFFCYIFRKKLAGVK